MRALILWIKYLLLLPSFILHGLFRPILPWIVVPFFSTPDKRHLRWPFQWFETWDVDLGGDEGWRTEHVAGTDPYSTWNRIKWLLRNGGSSASYTLFGCSVDDPHPFFRPYLPIGGGWRWDVMLGWNMKGAQKGLAKMCFVVFRFKRGDTVEFDNELLD